MLILHFYLKIFISTAQVKQPVNRFLNRCCVFANNKMCSLMQLVLSIMTPNLPLPSKPTAERCFIQAKCF